MNTAEQASGVRLWLILMKAYRAMSAIAESDVKEQGMCMSDFAVLELLLHKGTLPVNTIGQKIMLTSGSISVAIDRLESRGLVVRAKSPKDGRVTLVALTPDGHGLISEIFITHENTMEIAAERLNGNERRQLIRLLKKLGGVDG
jgi:MarR family 2-MHQ and catechol resistance regulon transcriptional repressor